MLKADLHSHTHFSKDCLTSPQKYVATCLKRDINCVAVTDHNSIQGGLAVREIAPFKVIVAEEVRTTQGEITGLFLTEEIPSGLSPEETVRRIKEQGGLVSVPHPFDRFRGEPIEEDALLRILPQADIVEVFNSRTTLPADNDRARKLAEEHGLAMGAGSDAHSHWEIGRCYVEMPDFDGTPQGFLEALRQGRIVARSSNPLIHFVSRWAVMMRKLGLRPLPTK